MEPLVSEWHEPALRHDEARLLPDLAKGVLPDRLPRFPPPTQAPPFETTNGVHDRKVAGVVPHEGHRREDPPLRRLAWRTDEVDVGGGPVGETHSAHPSHSLVTPPLLHAEPAALQCPEEFALRGR